MQHHRCSGRQQTIIGNVERKPWEYKLMMRSVTGDDAVKLKLL